MLDYITTYGLLLFCYSIFLLATIAGYNNKSGQLSEILSGKGDLELLYCRLIIGIVFLGIADMLILEIRDIESNIFIPNWEKHQLITWLAIVTTTILGSLAAIKKVYTAGNSPRFLPHHLPLSFIFIRTFFLIVYEFFFRGVMLFVMIADLGIASAVIINLIFYVFVNWPDKSERYSSILMGCLLCFVSIYYQSVWPAVLIHVSLALSHEITLLINNKSLIKNSWL